MGGLTKRFTKLPGKILTTKTEGESRSVLDNGRTHPPSGPDLVAVAIEMWQLSFFTMEDNRQSRCGNIQRCFEIEKYC